MVVLKKEEVKLDIRKFTQNGELEIIFNQKLNVPFNFIEN